MRFRVFAGIIIGAAALAVLLNACTSPRTTLDAILASGELRILTRNSPTTYYHGPYGPAGLEYELARAFAKHLGVQLTVVVEDDLHKILRGLRRGEAHIAAAGLTITDERQALVRFAPPYQHISQQLVYRLGSNPRPRGIEDILSGDMEVVANSSHAEHLRQLQQLHPDLKWRENREAGSGELLGLVAEQLIDYTIADSNEVAMNRRYHSSLRVGFDISEPQPLAWALPNSNDTSLHEAVTEFFTSLEASGELARLIKHHYEHVRNYDYAGTPTFLRHANTRLPEYRYLFEKAAAENDLDWRLLAAVAYQESHWNPLAVSPTGVRGIMMLTQRTAGQLGVVDRTDPQESIDGGARYIRHLYSRFPDINESDRIWFALAAYNVGYGHVRDTQWLTMNLGGNPNKWTDVKAHLPLLRQRKWYRQTRYGYARGNEPVTYVENIRSYYDILVWQHAHETPRPRVPHSILAYSSPVL